MFKSPFVMLVKKKNDVLCEMGASDCIDFVIYYTFAYLLVSEIKKETAWPELKIRLRTYIWLLLMYNLLVTLLYLEYY